MKLAFVVIILGIHLISGVFTQNSDQTGENPQTITDEGILLKLFTPQRISDGVKQVFNAIELKVRLASLVRKMLTPENLRENLSLMRKITNFMMRLSKFVLRYLPTPEPERGYLEGVFPENNQQSNDAQQENNDESPEVITQEPLENSVLGADISDPNIDQETLQKLIFGEPPKNQQ